MVKQEVDGTQASQLLSSGRLMLKTTLTTIQVGGYHEVAPRDGAMTETERSLGTCAGIK